MRIKVNGCRLYVDVVGSGLTAEGPKMVERPVVFVLNGGPGADLSLIHISEPTTHAAISDARVVEKKI